MSGMWPLLIVLVLVVLAFLMTQVLNVLKEIRKRLPPSDRDPEETTILRRRLGQAEG